MQKAGFLAAVAAVALGVSVTSMSTEARTIRVDFGAGNYVNSGQAWQLAETPLIPPGSVSGTLPFAINFGTGNQTAFTLFEDGRITFGAASIEPLAADWLGTGTASILDSGSITYNEGNLARGDPSSFPADPLDAPQAVRFTWNDITCATCGGFQYTFQVILIDMGGGDFDLELNYNGVPAGVGIARFTLGSNTLPPFGGPFDPNTDYDFQFRNGVLVGSQVPEPGVPSLLALGFLALAAAGLRRRAVPGRAAA